MRKRLFSSMLSKVIFALVLLCGIGFLLLYLEKQGSNTTVENTEELLSASDFEVQEYTYEDADSNTVYLLVVKNNSDYTVNLDCNTTAYEEDGTYIGITYNRINTVEPGNSGCMVFDFEYKYAERFEYKLYYEVSSTPSGVSNLETEEDWDGSMVTVTCKNTGNTLLKYTRADIIFFNNDAVVSYDFSYIHEKDSSDISQDQSLSHDFDCDEDFDDFVVYYTCQY